jgi:hypothetical protein
VMTIWRDSRFKDTSCATVKVRTVHTPPSGLCIWAQVCTQISDHYFQTLASTGCSPFSSIG